MSLIVDVRLGRIRWWILGRRGRRPIEEEACWCAVVSYERFVGGMETDLAIVQTVTRWSFIDIVKSGLNDIPT